MPAGVLKSPRCASQANTVGVAEANYKPGVVVGVVNEGAAGQRAGLQRGDVLLEVGSLKVAPAPDSVQSVVRTIRCVRGPDCAL